MSKEIFFRSVWGDEHCGRIRSNEYIHGGGVALSLWVNDDGYPEPWADMTVNLDVPAADGCVFLDTNNFPEVVEIFRDYALGEPTGRVRASGWCVYPEYQLNNERLNEYVAG